MKITEHDKGPLIERNKSRDNRGRPGIESRMREDGITHLTPNQVRDRMAEHGLTYEEALVYLPMTPSERGRKGRKGSHWGKWMPEEEREAKSAAERKK